MKQLYLIRESTMNYNQPSENPLQRPLLIGDWIVIFFLTSIPVVGFVLIVYWSLADDVNINKKNFSKAVILVIVILIVLTITLILLYGQHFSNININNPRLI